MTRASASRASPEGTRPAGARSAKPIARGDARSAAGAQTPSYYTDYLSERKDHKRTRQFLDRSLTLLELECGRRELRGEDVGHIRSFIREART